MPISKQSFFSILKILCEQQDAIDALVMLRFIDSVPMMVIGCVYMAEIRTGVTLLNALNGCPDNLDELVVLVRQQTGMQSATDYDSEEYRDVFTAVRKHCYLGTQEDATSFIVTIKDPILFTILMLWMMEFYTGPLSEIIEVAPNISDIIEFILAELGDTTA